MSGKWLMEKGFYIGDVLEVIESKNMLILTKIGTYAEIHKNKKEINILKRQLAELEN